jgi:hypothetical protein
MFLKPRRRRQGSFLQTNIAPGALREDRRPADIEPMPPDSRPPPDERGAGPVDDATLSDYEREIDRLDAAVRSR